MGMFDKIKQAATELTETALAEPKKAYVDDAKSPFVGFEIDENGNAIGRAPAGPHNLLLAGTGAGKGRRVFVPQIITWDGPVCAVSAKGDLAELAAGPRAMRGGPVYLMDLTGQVDLGTIPTKVEILVNDPCALLVPDENGSTDDSAMDLATLLIQVGALSMGGGKGGGGGDSGFWATLSLGVLACLLQAGSGYPDPDTGEWVKGGGINWVRRAALYPSAPEGTEGDLDDPNWDAAAMRAALIDSVHAEEVEATKELDPKQRDSVGINLRVALKSWTKRAVRGDENSIPFTPDLLEDPKATFFLVSPSSGTAASAATSVIESLVNHWMLNVRKDLPAIAMVIDECPQICPLPRLDEWCAVMRSYGMHFSVAAQSSKQFVKKFGKDEAEALFAIFPSILIGFGAIEKDLLELAAWAEPPTERRVESVDSNGRRSTSTDKTETFHGSELLPRNRSEGRLLIRGLSGMKVKLADFSDM